MLSAVLGNNREIFFPKLDSAMMQTFDVIATNLLECMGYEVDYCNTDLEAIEKSKKWNHCDPYPVHFSKSDTSGEKAYEEFYIEGEKIDLSTYKSLGVIKDKPIPNKQQVNDLINSLERAFENPKCTKSDIVNIFSDYLPNFVHIETGKNLDDKM